MPNKRGYTIPYYKKPRKPRAINNSIVNIDDVFCEPGLRNINWLSIAKKKLTHRELRLLDKRLRKVDRIIIASIQQFIHRNQNTFNFNLCIDVYKKEIRHKLISSQSAIMSLYSQSIANMLQKWNGGKTDKQFPSFRNYFQNCRRGFDTKKITMMTIHCWIPFMQLIQEFAMKAASRLFGDQRFERELRTSFRDYLNVLVLKCVFEGRMKPANTRNICVIPAMSYKVFLKRYNHYLRIVLETRPKKNKAIRKEYLRCIHIKHDDLKEVFDGRLNPHLPQHLPSVPIQNGNVFSDVPYQNDYVSNNSGTQDPSRAVSALWSAEDTFETTFANHLSLDNTNPMSNIQSTLPSISYPAIPVNENKEYFTTEPLRVDDPSNVSAIRSTQQGYYAENTFKTEFGNAFSFGTDHTNQMSRNQTALSSYPVNGNYGDAPLEPVRVDDWSNTFAMRSTHQAYASNVPFQPLPVDAPNPSEPFSFGTDHTNQMNRNQTVLSSYPVNGNYGDAPLEPVRVDEAPNTFAMRSTHQAYASNVPFQQIPVDAPNSCVPQWQPCHCCCCYGCCNSLYN